MDNYLLIRDSSQTYISRFEELQICESLMVYNQFYDHSRARDHAMEFKLIKKITETRDHANRLVGNYGDIISLNRYPDILPYNDTMLTPSNTNYMNASAIHGYGPDSAYMFIATQGPLDITINHFWQLVWENQVSLIIMSCNIIEESVEKCAQYYPDDEGCILSGDFEIFLINKEYKYPSLIKRVLKMINHQNEEEKKITHLQFVSWPDMCVPLDEGYESVCYALEKIEKKWDKNKGKILVHCSAGIGRTGVLIGVFNMIRSIKLEGKFSVFRTVRLMREQRWGMVANEEQYSFMYKFMEYWISSYML